MHWKHHHWADPGRGTGRSCAFVRPARMPPQSWLYFDKRNIQAAPHRVVAPLKVSVWPGNSFCSVNCDMRVLDSTVKSWFLRQQEPSEITCLSVYFMAKQARTKRNDFVEALWHFFPQKRKKNWGGICEPGWGILTWKMCMRKDALVFILVSRCMAASCHSGGLHRFLSRSDCSFSLSLQVPKSPLKYICCDTPQPKIHTHDRVKPHHSNRAKQLTKSGISFILSPTSDFNQPFQWSQFVTRWTCLLSLGLRLLTQSA